MLFKNNVCILALRATLADLVVVLANEQEIIILKRFVKVEKQLIEKRTQFFLSAVFV